MKYPVCLGVVCLARNTFDYPAAQKLYDEILISLNSIENVEIVSEKNIIMDVEDAIRVGNMFSQKQVHAIAIISGTFHLGHLALEIKKHAEVPLLLWGLPELPYDGGKIRLNSVCGVNMNASNLIKSGITDFTYTVGNTIDENWLDAIRMMVSLKESRLGLIGSRAHGFFNVGVNELSMYGKFGTLVDYFPLTALWETEVKKEEVEKCREILENNFVTTNLSNDKKHAVAELSAKFSSFAKDNALSAIAIRCWPEFAAQYGIAPCASMSIVQSEGLLLSCEGDLDCAITMIAHKAAGAVTPFMADLSQVNPEENTALMWHCGVAPCNLQDGICEATLDTYHGGGRGVTAGFVMKQGRINMARLDSIAGEYRLFMRSGESLPMDKELAGTYAKVRFDMPMSEVLDSVIYNGIAHHVSMVYGDYSKTFDIFARLKGIPKI